MERLSVTIPIERKLDLLEGALGTQLSNLLALIPTEVDLPDCDASVVADGSSADQAWKLLKSQHGLGWVSTGKILARKRPQLLPVYDRWCAVRWAVRDRSGSCSTPRCARTTAPCIADCVN